MVEIGVNRHDFGVGDGGQVDRLGGVDAAGVDQQLKGLERNRRVLTFGAGRKAGASQLWARYRKGEKSRQKSGRVGTSSILGRIFFPTIGIFHDRDEHRKSQVGSRTSGFKMR